MRGLLKNVFSLAASDAATRLIGFFVTVYLARVLGPGYFGVISVGIAVLGYLGNLSGAGVQLLESRNTAASRTVDADRVGIIVTLRLVLGSLIILATLATVFAFVEPDMRDAIWLYSLIMIPLALSLEWFFQGRESFGFMSASKVMTTGVYAISVFLLVHTPLDFRFAPVSFVTGYLAGSLLLITVFAMKYGRLRLSWKPEVWRDVLKKSLPLSVALLFGQSAGNLGPIIVGLLFAAGDVGMYSAAMKIIILLLLADRVLNSIYLPLISRVKANEGENVPQIVSSTMRIVLAVVIPTAVCCFSAAEELVLIIFGEEYIDAVPYFRVLLGYFAITLPNSIFVCTLLAFGREKVYTRILLVGSIVLAVLMGVLALVIGPVGAAAGVVAGELIMVGLFFIATKKVVKIDALKILLPVIPGLLALTGMLYFFSGEFLVTGIVSGLVLFVALLFISGGLRVADLKVLGDQAT